MSYRSDSDTSSNIVKSLKFSELLKKKIDPDRARELKEKRGKEMRDYIIQSQQSWYSSLSRHDLDNKSWQNLDITSEELASAVSAVKAWDPDCEYGLFVHGDPGNGKTHMMKALIIDHFSKDRQFLFRSMSDVMEEMKDFENKEFYHHKLNQPYGLVLDDLGTERASEFEQNELFRIIENRMKNGKRVFMTSNLNIDALKEKYSERIISRLGECMVFIENKAPSHRAEIFLKNHTNIKKKLTNNNITLLKK